MSVDDLPHFFIRCLKVKEFWLHWFSWWESLFGIVIRNSHVIEECILFGFRSNSDLMQLLNFCTLYAKYYIYISNVYLIITHLISIPAWTNLSKAWKQKKLYVKQMIRKTNSSSTTLSMRIYKAIMKILYVIMYLRLCIHCLKKSVFKIPTH